MMDVTMRAKYGKANEAQNRSAERGAKGAGKCGAEGNPSGG